MANPGNPKLAPAGLSSAVGNIADDNFGQRIGIGLAVSIGVNLALFAGASLMAQEKSAITDNGPVLVISPANPTAAPTPVPTPSATPLASPTPVAKPTPQPTPVVRPTPVARPTPRPQPVVRPTPRPRPATPQPIATPPPVKPQPRPTVAPRQPIKPAVVATITKSIKVDPTIATPPPRVVAELKTYRATNPNAMNLGSRTGTTLQRSARTSSTSAAIAAASASAGAAGSPGATPRSVAEGRRGAAGSAGAIGEGPKALNPIVVAPTADSTLSGSTRQLRTVQGTASRLAGHVGVISLSAKASSASTSSFVVSDAPGNLRAGTVTARQGTSAAGGATAMSGTPTVISNGAEYSVSAPGAPDRGPIGVRGNKNSIIGGSVTSLQAKGNTGDVAAGVAVYGDAPGGNQKGAAGRKAVAAAGQAGELSAVGGNGIAVTGTEGTGEGGAGRAGAAGVKGGGGRGLQGAAAGAGGAGGKVAGGSGEVYGDPNGVPGGAVRANVAVNVAKAGDVKVDKATVAVDTKVVKNIDTIQTKGPEDLKFDEIDEIATDRAVTQAPAKASSKPTWDPPNVKYTGSIEVRVTINADGSHSEDIKSTGVGELDSYLRSFFSKWRWEPGKLDGKAIKTIKTVRFRIN